MNRLLMIAKNNMKRQKGDMITFFILTFIAAFLLTDCLSALLGMGKILDERFQAINGAHMLLYHSDTPEENEAADKAFRDNPRIEDVEATPLLMQYLKFRKEGEAEYREYTFFLTGFEGHPLMQNVVDEGKNYAEDEIVLPLQMKGGFALGDVIEFLLGKHSYKFKVAGYAEDPYLCQSMNFTVYSAYVSDKALDRMMEDEPVQAPPAVLHKGRMTKAAIEEGYDTQDLEKEIADAYKENLATAMEEHPERDYTKYIAVNWDLMRGGASFLPGIVMGVIMIFSLIILVVAVTIIAFSVKNFITRNMKNTGILEASGYTVKELRLALVLELLLVALSGSILGVGLAAFSFGPFGNILTGVLGLSWNQPVNVFAIVVTLLGLTLMVVVLGILTSRTYKKITVLDALRGGITAHNYRKNFFPMEKTHLPLPVAMSLKETFGGLGRNIVMALIVCLITITALLGFGMLDNYGSDSERMFDLMGFESGLAEAQGSEDMGDDLRKLPGVKNVLGQIGFEPVIKVGDKEAQTYTYAVDDFANTTNLVMIDGRKPKHDNEILITEAVADDLGVSIGDAVTLSFAGKEADFIIVGTNQRMERMGRTAVITIASAKKIISGTMFPQYMITGEEGVTFDAMKEELNKYAESKGIELEVADIEKNLQDTMDVLVAAMKSVCAVITIVTILIVIFVESLVIRAKVTREWKNMGISKGLGMTTKDEVLQIMLSNIPAILVGCIVGLASASWVGRKMCLAIFSIFGLKRMAFDIAAGRLVTVFVGILVVALVTAALSGLKVRRLNPVEMITEE